MLRGRRQGIADDGLRFLQHAAQMIRSAEALCIDLVDILGPLWTRREPLQHCLLLRSGRGLNSVLNRFTELPREVVVDFTGISAHPGRDLRREQSWDYSVFVRRPDAATQRSPCCQWRFGSNILLLLPLADLVDHSL